MIALSLIPYKYESISTTKIIFRIIIIILKQFIHIFIILA